jgi:hypothetical protein
MKRDHRQRDRFGHVRFCSMARDELCSGWVITLPQGRSAPQLRQDDVFSRPRFSGIHLAALTRSRADKPLNA